MTSDEIINRLLAQRTCLKCQVMGTVEETIETLETAIELLKKQKTGHWVDDNDGYGTSCSECGKWYTHPHLAKEEIIYCCRCGARMEGERNERKTESKEI